MYLRFAIRVGLAFTLVLTLAFVGVVGEVAVSAQGTLSNQVLAVFTRINTWVGTNTFNDLRVANAAVPSTTTYRIYADTSGNLYFNGGLIAGAGGGVTPHNILSSTHADSLAASVTRGDVIIGNSTPKWARLAIGANHTVLVSNGTDPSWGTDGSGLTGLVAANLTGALPVISGASLTSLNATNLGSGTVPLARLSGITNTEISGSAAIGYSKLSLSGSIVNADVNASAAITYSKLALATSVVNGDLANATILFAKWASNSCSASQFPMYNGAAWVCRTIVPGDITGAGTVTSVALSLPAIMTVSGSPVTTSGTLTGTLASQTQNLIFASPNGSSGAPTFRAVVNGDLPTSGVVAGSYPYVTVNAQGVITAGSTSLASGTLTASAPWTYTQTWNSGGVTFTGFLENITDSASAAGSLLMDLQVGGVSKWKVSKAGNVTVVGTETIAGLLTASAGWTVPTGQTTVVTDTDALSVGSNKISNTLTFTCAGLSATSASGDCVFVADRAYQVTSIKFVQKTAGGAGCAANIEKITGTTAPGSGTVMGTGSYDCNVTANNTVTAYTLTGTTGTLQLASGDRMGIKLAGTLTALAGLTATITLKAI